MRDDANIDPGTRGLDLSQAGQDEQLYAVDDTPRGRPAVHDNPSVASGIHGGDRFGTCNSSGTSGGSYMKVKPVILDNGAYVQVAPEKATHVVLRLPGPSGRMLLPVMLKGTREGTGNWTWNGDSDNPTLKPSVLTQSGHFDPSFKSEDSCWCKYYKAHQDEAPVFHCFRCHTWINDGKVQFLDDCSHEFKGQTLELLEV